ncbi:unnamed protein product [Toxocara canis]|uniref:Pept_C1 domain-containing protein n=1 Tax=Toxocara canis TaxID=6265 RepID=A0A183U896_TOXCA|nr:unnamed protein product [Toxocara canis]
MKALRAKARHLQTSRMTALRARASWGDDDTTGQSVKYWLAANSWGTSWGEEGFFRILRGENHCEIESFIIGAWGKGAKKRRFKVRKLRRHMKKL